MIACQTPSAASIGQVRAVSLAVSTARVQARPSRRTRLRDSAKCDRAILSQTEFSTGE